MSLCQILYVHAHYFNKAHFASCDCSIKRIVDDLGSVVKLMFLHKGIRDAGLDNSEVTAGPPPSPHLPCYRPQMDSMSPQQSVALWNMLQLLITQDKQHSSVKFSTNGIID